MVTFEIQDYPDCETHHSTALSYCALCDTFLCITCFKVHPESHLEDASPDIQRVIKTKFENILAYQKLRTQILDLLSKIEDSLSLLVQKLIEKEKVLQSQQNELKMQAEQDNQFIQSIKTKDNIFFVNSSNKTEFYKLLTCSRPSLDALYNETSKFTDTFELIQNYLLEMPSVGSGSETEEKMQIENVNADELDPANCSFDQSSNFQIGESLSAQDIEYDINAAVDEEEEEAKESLVVKEEHVDNEKSKNKAHNSKLELEILSPLTTSNGPVTKSRNREGSGVSTHDIDEEKKLLSDSPKTPIAVYENKIDEEDQHDLLKANVKSSITLKEKVKKTRKPRRPTATEARVNLLKMLKANAPKLLCQEMEPNGTKVRRVSEKSLKSFIISQNGMVRSRNIGQEWKTAVDDLLSQYGELVYSKSQIYSGVVTTVRKLEEAMKTKLDDQGPGLLADIINTTPIHDDIETAFLKIKFSLISTSEEEMNDLKNEFRFLRWHHSLTMRAKARKHIDDWLISPERQKNRPIMKIVGRAMRSLFKQVMINKELRPHHRHKWAFIASIVASSQIAPFKLWTNVLKVGNQLQLKAVLDAECRLLRGIENFVTEKLTLKNCFRKLERDLSTKAEYERKTSSSLFLFVLRKQQSLDKISKTKLSKTLRPILKDYKQILKQYKNLKMNKTTQGANALKVKLERFPFILLDLYHFLDSKEYKVNRFHTLLKDYIRLSSGSWQSLVNISEKILQLSLELSHHLPKELEEKILLVAELYRHVAISSNLRADTKYSEITRANKLIDRLEGMEPRFIAHTSFLRMRVWLSTVRLIKAVLDGKIESLDPLLLPEEAREIQKQGLRYYGTNDQSRKDLVEKQTMMKLLVVNMEQKLNEIQRIKDPEEWEWFDHEYLGVIDLTKELLKKQRELSKEFIFDDFDESTWLEKASKIEIVKSETNIKTEILTDFVPELNLLDKFE